MAMRDAFRRTDAGIILGLIVLDQFTKLLVRTYVPVHETVPVIPGLLNLTHVQNTGAAFGILNSVDLPYKPLLVTTLAVVALVAIAAYALRFGTETWVGRLGLTLVLAGAIGNLIDRAARGFVVDFVDFYWGSVHFWAFNVADASITVGACALILEMLGAGRHVSQAV